MSRRLIVVVVFCLNIAVSAPLHGDMIPTHGAVVHQDPFVPGWPVPPSFAPPVAGSVIPGDGILNPGDPEYNVVGPHTCDVIPGTDNHFAPAAQWHWQWQLDLNPYGPNGVIPITLFGNGPYLLALGAGPEITVDFHQPDYIANVNSLVSPNGIGTVCAPQAPHGVETGGFDKALWNLTPLVLAWGTSVTENQICPLTGGCGDPPPYGRTVTLSDGQQFFFPTDANDPNGSANSLFGDEGGLFLEKTPEPTTLSLLGLGVLALLRRRR